MLRFTADGVAVDVDLERGGRLASLRVGDRELLVTAALDTVDWGWYPMAPWAGRTRRGTFACDGIRYRLPLHADGHALHGTVFKRTWAQDGPVSWWTDLGRDWPFAGRVRQSLELLPDSLLLNMELTSEEAAFPAAIGWHPWFRRQLGEAAASVDLAASFMLERDGEGVATDRRVPVPPGPWDDCFGGLERPVAVRWPAVLELTIESDCPYVVVFSEHPAGLCVEPQTGPPNVLNDPIGNAEPHTVTPDRPMKAWMKLSWRHL